MHTNRNDGGGGRGGRGGRNGEVLSLRVKIRGRFSFSSTGEREGGEETAEVVVEEVVEGAVEVVAIPDALCFTIISDK